MAQLPISNTPGPQSQSAGPLGAPRGIHMPAKESGNGHALLFVDNKMELRVQRHAQWAQITQIHEKAVRLKGMESKLSEYHAALMDIAKLTTRSTVNVEALSARAERIGDQLRADSIFDGNLDVEARPPSGAFILKRIDLLKARPESESLLIRLPNGGLSRLDYTEGQSMESNFQMVSKELSEHGLASSISEAGELRVTGPKSNLESPWMFQGQGVRVPAGNAVNIKLTPEQDELGRLAVSLTSGNREESRGIIASLVAKIGVHQKAVREEQEAVAITTRRMGIRDSYSSTVAKDMSANTGKSIAEADFRTQLMALSAQANLTRESVVSALTE